MDSQKFCLLFESLTGNKPFPWQEALFFKWFAEGKIPSCCDLPTGLGKTSVVAIWLIALAFDSEKKLPRRLVYVVNRRTVVDQTTDEVGKYREILSVAEETSMLGQLRAELEKRCALPIEPAIKPGDHKRFACPLALSTLRGQFADNREWSADPCRPAVIVGTVDMIGSRLLFSGYGRLGRYSKSSQAALLAQDTLILLDEAHLCPAFDKTLRAMDAQLHRKATLRPFHVLSLSATVADKNSVESSRIFHLERERDLKPESTVFKRVTSKKTLQFISESKEAEIPKKMAAEAVRLGSQNQAVVIFCNTIDWVE